MLPFLGLPCPPGNAATAHKMRYFAFERDWLYMARTVHGMELVRIYDRIYDITAFADEHPGGRELILAASGGDATAAWEYVEHSEHACRVLKRHARPDLDLQPEVVLQQMVDTNGVDRWKKPREPMYKNCWGRSASSFPISASLPSWSAAGGYAWEVGKQALECLLQTGDHNAVHGTSMRHQACLSLLGKRVR